MQSNKNPTVVARGELSELEEHWVALQSAEPPPSVFLTYAWHDAAIRWQADNAEPYLLSVTGADGQPQGICPLVRVRRATKGITYRALEFIQVPDTQMSDIVAAEQSYATTARAVAGYLSQQKHWDVIRLSHLPADSARRQTLTDAFKTAGLAVNWTRQSGNPCIRLDRAWDEFYATRSRRLKKGNNLIANKLKRAHSSIEIEWLYGPGVQAGQWAEALENAKALSAKSWKNATGFTLDRPGPAAFIDCLSEHAIAGGWLSLWLLRLDGVAVAMEYQIVYQGRVHALRSDYDEARAEQSPGTYLNWKLLERLFEQSLLRYEMGPGDNPYKQRWAEDELPLGTLTVYNTTWKGRLLNVTERFIKPLLQSARAAVGRGTGER